MLKPNIVYWMVNYRPSWEAVSNEVQFLMKEMEDQFDTNMISFNFNEAAPSLRGREKRLPLPLSLPLIPAMIYTKGRAGINHLFCGPAEKVLSPRLSRFPSVLTISKNTKSLSAFERNFENLKRFEYVVTESERDHEILLQAGLPRDRVKLIYPGFEIKPYVPAPGPFTILFATAPFDKNEFLNRGIFLIINAAQSLAGVRFRLIWRDGEHERLLKLIADAGVTNIEVHNGYIPDMDAQYCETHATILPGLDEHSLKPCPHSGLESLAHGKPLLVSRPTSIAGLVERMNGGIVFEPNSRSLVSAITELQKHYDSYQSRCHNVVNECFSKQVFIERYRDIYKSMHGMREAST